MINFMKNNVHHAFTLGETLFVIGIISIVAAFTTPSLVSSYKDKVIASKVKKTYSILTQAYTSSKNSKGTPIRWHLVDEDDTGATGYKHWFKIQFQNNVKVLKNCGITDASCFNSNVKTLKGDATFSELSGTTYDFITQDGVAYALRSISHNCTSNKGTGALKNTCGLIFIDIDGPNKGHSIAGKDVFVFYLTKTGVLSYNAGSQSKDGVSYDCYTTGNSCASWILRYGNAKYKISGNILLDN